MDIVGTVTAPARLGFRIAGWGIRTAAGLLPVGGGEEPRGEPAPAPAPAPAETVVRPAPPEPVPEAPPQPTHVDEGATVVAEFAEEGAEDGVGAEVELDEPWDGYDRLHADEVAGRLGEASAEALAAVVLYERSVRGRPSIIDAAEEQLRLRTTPR